MTQTTAVRVAVIGCGGAARDYHIRRTLQSFQGVEIVVVCEPSSISYEATVAIFQESGKTPPPTETDLNKLLHDYHNQLEIAVIATPHALHLSQTVACMRAGLDVLLEKPMVASLKSWLMFPHSIMPLLASSFSSSLSAKCSSMT